MITMSDRDHLLNRLLGPNGTQGRNPYFLDELPPDVIKAVSGAYEIPGDLEGVVAEIAAWSAYEDDALENEGHAMSIAAEVRVTILREIMLSRPARSIADISARVGWWHRRLRDDAGLTAADNAAIHDRLQADLRAHG